MRALIFPAALLLVACANDGSVAEMNATTPVPPAAAPAPDQARPAPGDELAVCDTGKVQGHIGHPYAAAMGDQIRAQSGARSLRVIRPGQPVTMDYRNDRLNIELDAQSRIVALRCG